MAEKKRKNKKIVPVVKEKKSVLVAEKKGFFANLIDKLDKKLEKKSKEKSCGCGNSGESCCNSGGKNSGCR